MDLQSIEQTVLLNAGYDRYSSLSADSNTEKQEDFAMLHRCVFFARDEIQKNCPILGTKKITAVINMVANTSLYTIPETDFDIPIKMFYYDTNSIVTELEAINEENFLRRMGTDGTVTGQPCYYYMFGSTGALANVYFLPTPDVSAGGVIISYKPVLPNITTSTDEDIIMKKYPLTVIKLATAYALMFFKKDMTGFTNWLNLGRADFKEINRREVGLDYNPIPDVDDFLATKRLGRNTI